MPVVKHSAIHVTPLKAIEYVINGEKTDDCKYVSGINVSTTADGAYEDFRINYELHTGERFFRQSLPENGRKERIRLHHYIQSFKPGEVTPELAHKIAKEWAESMFYKNGGIRYQLLICTHVDREHIHNHILLSSVDLDGKVWHDNKKTLTKAKEVSDKLALHHNLSVIENPKKGTMLSYSEYLAKQNNCSWKDDLRNQIDVLVLQPDVRSISDFSEKLKMLGYEISGRKYLHIKRSCDKNRKPMSTLKLGDGYGMEELQYRIEHKNVIMTLAEVNGYSGIQRNYALCLRQTQFLLYHKEKSSCNVSYGTVRKSYELLCYLHNNNIHSVSELESVVNAADEKYRKLNEKKKSLEERMGSAEKLLALDADEFFRCIKDRRFMESHKFSEEVTEKYRPFFDNLVTSEERYEEFKRDCENMRSKADELDIEIEKAKSERKEVTGYYKTYLSQIETDYDRMLREMKALYDITEEGITETYEGELDAVRYLAEIYRGSVTENTYIDYERLERDYDRKYGLDDRQSEKNFSYEYDR